MCLRQHCCQPVFDWRPQSARLSLGTACTVCSGSPTAIMGSHGMGRNSGMRPAGWPSMGLGSTGGVAGRTNGRCGLGSGGSLSDAFASGIDRGLIISLPRSSIVVVWASFILANSPASFCTHLLICGITYRAPWLQHELTLKSLDTLSVALEHALGGSPLPMRLPMGPGRG
jgi:hypothetical protein